MSGAVLEAPEQVAFDAHEFRVSRIRALRGPNYWRLAPVIACDVRLGALEDVKSSDIPGFCDRLLQYLPSLEDHPCTVGATGGFVQRMREGTHLPHISSTCPSSCRRSPAATSASD